MIAPQLPDGAGGLAFEDVYRHHERDVVRYLTLLLGRPDDAEDLAADTFQRAFEAWRAGRGPAGRPLPWLLTIARRQALNRWRRRRLIDWLPMPISRRDLAADASAADREFWLWLDALARALPERQREVLVLRYRRDLDDQEIGEVMNLTASGVRRPVASGPGDPVPARPSGAAAMNDDEILDTIDRRFAGVEARLPPRRVPIVDAATGSTLRRGPTLGPGPVPLTLIVVAAIAVTLALGSRLSTGVGGDARPSGSSAIAAVESDSAPASAASESPNVAPLLILRGSADGDTLLVEHFRWGPCLSSGYDSIAAPDGAAIDRAIDRAGVDEGWVDVEIPFARPSGSTMRGWVGATAESAAVGYGSPVIAFGGRGNTWIVQGGKGRQLLSFATPKGRTFWILANSVAKGPCGGATP